MRLTRIIPCVVFIMLAIASCKEHYTPKPRGYIRIEMPARGYTPYTEPCPFQFEYPSYGKIVPDLSAHAEPCWLNVEMPALNGKIHLSYKPIHNNLGELMEDSRTLVYKHTLKADAIEEMPIIQENAKVYGILYDVKGNAASSLQFVITDSTSHFVRAALYFNCQPNYDSLYPVIQFIKEDVLHLISSWRWKK